MRRARRIAVTLTLACALSLAACDRGTPASLAPSAADSLGSRARSIVSPELGGGAHHHPPLVGSVAEYFGTLGQRFVPNAARGMHVVYQFDLGAQGTYQVIVDDGTMRVLDGAPRHADAILTMNGGDYLRMVNGQLDGAAAYLGGRLKIAGSLRLARRMRELFPPAR